MQIPRPVIAGISRIIHYRYKHTELDRMFLAVDAPGEPPAGNRLAKCMEWLKRINEEPTLNPLEALGGVIKDFMERCFPVVNTLTPNPEPSESEKSWQADRDDLRQLLAKHNLAYSTGGHVRKIGVAAPTRSFEAILEANDFPAVEEEFKRALDNVDTDPATSITAACALIEALCKRYIRDKGLAMPRKQTIKPLWDAVRADLGFDPSSIEDTDLRKILTGLSSIVDGLGALRTHAGNAHGRDEGEEDKPTYKVEPRHARLANHAAHTLATFLIETWQKREST